MCLSPEVLMHYWEGLWEFRRQRQSLTSVGAGKLGFKRGQSCIDKE